MPFPSGLQCRQLEPEWMDDPDIDPKLLAGAFAGLRRVNTFATSRWAIRRHLREVAKTAQQPIRVLDLGSGTGDVALWLTRKALADGVDVVVDGCDLSPLAVEKSNAMADELGSASRFFAADLTQDELPNDYDFAISSLFFHHLEEADVVGLLGKVRAAVRRGVFFDDLRRTSLGYWTAQAGCRLLSRSPVVHADGPSSVRAAFTINEFRCLAEQAGMTGVTFERQWPQRFLMVWQAST